MKMMSAIVEVHRAGISGWHGSVFVILGRCSSQYSVHSDSIIHNSSGRIQ